MHLQTELTVIGDECANGIFAKHFTVSQFTLDINCMAVEWNQFRKKRKKRKILSGGSQLGMMQFFR